MDAYLTVLEVAALMRVDPKTVYRMLTAGELPRIPIGRGKSKPRIRIRQSAVEAYMASREKQGIAMTAPSNPPPPPRPGRPTKAVAA